MRVLVTGGTGALGRAFLPVAEAARHDVRAPGRSGLDLFDPLAVGAAMRDVDAVFHLATRIQPLDRMQQPEAWRENDRLRAEASAILVDAALAAQVKTYVQPTVTFVYPGGRPVSEETPVGEVAVILRSALAAEQQTARCAGAGRRGVVLRLGLLDGPGTGKDHPNPADGGARRQHRERRPAAHPAGTRLLRRRAGMGHHRLRARFWRAAAARRPSETRGHRGRFDLPGAIAGTGGLAALVYGLSNAATSPDGVSHWGDIRVVASLSAAVVLLAAFAAMEVRSRDPLVPLHLLRSRDRSGASASTTCSGPTRPAC